MSHADASRIGRELDRLEQVFGRPRPGRRHAPLDELILTILSQHTSDGNRDRAYRAMRRRFATWDRVLRARREDLEDALRVGGLARTKSRVIQDVLRTILRDWGQLNLEALRKMPTAEAKTYLLHLKGVGEKTACCVLLFALGREAFPVDTHIHRIASRLGWVSPRARATRVHALLAALIPPERCYSAHINLITLGRRVCRARTPACPSCPVLRECRYAARKGWSGPPRGPRPRPTLY